MIFFAIWPILAAIFQEITTKFFPGMSKLTEFALFTES